MTTTDIKTAFFKFSVKLTEPLNQVTNVNIRLRCNAFLADVLYFRKTLNLALYVRQKLVVEADASADNLLCSA